MQFLVHVSQTIFFILIPLTLPFTSYNFSPPYTSSEFMDLVFSGQEPGLSLHAYLFAGQFVAGWGVLMLEASEKGTEGELYHGEPSLKYLAALCYTKFTNH